VPSSENPVCLACSRFTWKSSGRLSISHTPPRSPKSVVILQPRLPPSASMVRHRTLAQPCDHKLTLLGPAEKNIDVLADAGTLGALLALIDLEDNDVASIRDAAIALSQMVVKDYVKERFLQAPNGLLRIFRVLESQTVSLKSTALQVLINLCTNIESQICLVRSGGLKLIFQELMCHDENIKRATSILIRQFTSSAIPKDHLVDYDVLQICRAIFERLAVKNVYTTRDVSVERCVLEYYVVICVVKSMKAELVELGVMTYLLKALTVEELPEEYSLLIVKALQELVVVEANQPRMLAEGLLATLARLCFGSLVKRSSRARSTRRIYSAGAGGGDESGMELTHANSTASLLGGTQFKGTINPQSLVGGDASGSCFFLCCPGALVLPGCAR
jgi:hypothetical protein